MFFLLNRGHGYTDVGVKQMTMDEMIHHVRELSSMLEAQSKAHEQAVNRAKAKQDAMARRRR